MDILLGLVHFYSIMSHVFIYHYCNDPKFSERQVWANSETQIRLLLEQSDEGPHCLLYHLHHLEVSYHGRTF